MEQERVMMEQLASDEPETQMAPAWNMAKIMSIDDLLQMNLQIPDYQRPYKWSIKNMRELFEDISNALREAEKYKDYEYRIGTVILHKEGHAFQIVDGQQRITSLVMMKHYLSGALNKDFDCALLDKPYADKDSKRNLYQNYKYVQEWFSVKDKVTLEEFYKAFQKVLQVVVLFVERQAEAFQLFDSQNSRGKELDPHDLLKAFHLRAMKENPYEMERAVNIWEERNPEDIRDLFEKKLFPIWNWSRKRKTWNFTVRDIDVYKGVTEDSAYTYARRLSRVMPYYQLTEPFVMGQDFFEMVGHYLNLLSDVHREIETNSQFKRMKEVMDEYRKMGLRSFSHAENLFYCSLLCYYDRFHNFDVMAVTKLFAWSFMICSDLERFDFKTINKYAIGDASYASGYTNVIPMFAKITEARKHTEIAAIHLETRKHAQKQKTWEKLNTAIKTILGVAGKEDTHERAEGRE